MISTSGTTAATDPTMAALVPLRSRRRDVATLLAAVVALLAVGWFGVNGRPGLESSSSTGTALPGAQLLIAAQARATGILGPTLTSLTPPPGARVAGAWVLDAADPLLGGTTGAWDEQDVRDQLLAGARAGSALPQKLRAGREVQIVVLLDVVDCSALASDGIGPLAGSSTAHLRSTIGLTADIPLATLGYWADRQTLVQQGSCPAG